MQLSEHDVHRYVILLTKRRGALKLAVQKMVQKACVILESAPDKETTLKLIDTLRTVTAGKKISSSGDLLAREKNTLLGVPRPLQELREGRSTPSVSSRECR